MITQNDFNRADYLTGEDEEDIERIELEMKYGIDDPEPYRTRDWLIEQAEWHQKRIEELAPILAEGKAQGLEANWAFDDYYAEHPEDLPPADKAFREREALLK